MPESQEAVDGVDRLITVQVALDFGGRRSGDHYGGHQGPNDSDAENEQETVSYAHDSPLAML